MQILTRVKDLFKVTVVMRESEEEVAEGVDALKTSSSMEGHSVAN